MEMQRLELYVETKSPRMLEEMGPKIQVDEFT